MLCCFSLDVPRLQKGRGSDLFYLRMDPMSVHAARAYADGKKCDFLSRS